MKKKVVQLTRLVVLGCLLLGLCTPVFAQGGKGITVSGTVLDGDGLPVIGAAVTIKGTTQGAAAGVSGEFTLSVPDEDAILEFVALGYVTQEVKVGKQRTITIVLQEDS